MIGVHQRGRLGNQLFQYAFGHAVSRQLGCSFFMNRMPALRYFQASNTPLRNDLRRIWFDCQSYFCPQHVLLWEEHGRGPENIATQLRDDCYYYGYFQSERYFKPFEVEIRKEFRVRPKYHQLFQAEYGELFAKNRVVAVHVRRTDYVHLGLTLPLSYYEQCLKRVEGLEQALVIFVTDDPNVTQQLFSDYKGRYICVSNSEIVDFQILMNADCLIIANSSFSWWAAYLNANPHKIVYAPKYWFGFKERIENPKSIQVPEWQWVEF
jgi:hypothetical protein